MFSKSKGDMKGLNTVVGITKTLKTLVKYSAYIIVLVEVVEFAISKLEGLNEKYGTKEDQKEVPNAEK